MKKICICLVASGAVTGMMIGALSSLMTAVVIKEKLGLKDMMGLCKSNSDCKCDMLED